MTPNQIQKTIEFLTIKSFEVDNKLNNYATKLNFTHELDEERLLIRKEMKKLMELSNLINKEICNLYDELGYSINIKFEDY